MSMTGPAPGAITKPTVFLSHAATDEPIARVIHDEIRRIFAKGVNVFTSSVPGVVTPGADWLKGDQEQPRGRSRSNSSHHPRIPQPPLDLV